MKGEIYDGEDVGRFAADYCSQTRAASPDIALMAGVELACLFPEYAAGLLSVLNGSATITEAQNAAHHARLERIIREHPLGVSQ